MAKASSFRNRAIIILTLSLFFTLFNLVSVYSKVDTDKNPSGTIMIDLPSIDDENQMPAVRFFHDRHTEALKGKKDCSACHLKKDDRLVFRFKRMDNGPVKTDMDIYHTNCISCHQELTEAGEWAGPITGECRSCHKSDTESESSWTQLSFTKSLHYRHESSKLIKPLLSSETENCSSCHHKYNKDTRKLFYKKGEEESCVYCHKSSLIDNVSSMRTASHDACINCHQKISATKQKSGPVNCLGCHDVTEQKKITIVENVPRIKRNQPDTVLLSNWMTEPKETAGLSGKNHINPVPFNHLVHESNASNCRSCHHESLARCGTCHSSLGSDEGQFITLEQVMHDGRSDKSCVGCHNNIKTHKNCAGCHTLIPEKRFENMSCNTCHSVSGEKIDASGISKNKKIAMAKKALDKKKSGHSMIPDEKIPEKVTIGVMKDKYEAVDFPHRKIVHKLFTGIKESKMAGHFHDSNKTVCAACHHNTEPAEKPPGCATCHRSKVSKAQSERPGLKGAYHGQCISCHQKMNIQKPAATDCISCHKKRDAAVQNES